jgi:hypothetical protein
MADIGDSSSLSPLLPVTRPKKSGPREKPEVDQDKKKRQQTRDVESDMTQQPDQDEPKRNKIDDYA